MDPKSLQSFLKSLSQNYPYGIARSAAVSEAGEASEKPGNKLKAIFINESPVVPAHERDLFEAAVTKGLKFEMQSIRLIDSEKLLSDKANCTSSSYVLLGKDLAEKHPALLKILGKQGSVKVIETFSLSEVIASQAVKKQFWADIQQLLEN